MASYVHQTVRNDVIHVVTILSFIVVIPLAFGIRVFHRIPKALQYIVLLCAAWFITELAMYCLRIQGITNASLSYLLTAVEIYLFAAFYFVSTGTRIIRWIAFLGVPLIAFDWILFGTPLNTFSLAIEYLLITGLALHLFYQITCGRASADFFVINLTLLFYLLSSFPYFVAWEWLRTTNMDLLTTMSFIHLYVHAICYLVITFELWRSSLSYSHR